MPAGGHPAPGGGSAGTNFVRTSGAPSWPQDGSYPACKQAGLSRARMRLHGIHHVAFICSNYQRSKLFYTQTLGLKIVAETYRGARDSYKLDLAVADGSQIELFSFPAPPARVNNPEACGLRHLAFRVSDIA